MNPDELLASRIATGDDRSVLARLLQGCGLSSRHPDRPMGDLHVAEEVGRNPWPLQLRARALKDGLWCSQDSRRMEAVGMRGTGPMRRVRGLLVAATFCVALVQANPSWAQTSPLSTPVVIGASWRSPSLVYGVSREVNVWLPADYDAHADRRYPVVYLLDGGQTQDFHHISGLAQLGTISGTTRDVIVVGVASVDRRNELAVPTDDPELRRSYPTHGDTSRFRRYLADEVLPFIKTRYRTSGETLLMGESLAGLFVVETALRSPEMFDRYIAISPSLWWDGGGLSRQAGDLLNAHPRATATLWLAMADEGGEMQSAMDVLLAGLRDRAPPGFAWTYRSYPHQTHATIYHPVALDAFREILAAQ